MSDRINMDRPKKMVRFCMQGHEIVYSVGEIMRSVCPFCKSPIDRSRMPIPLEELEKKKEEEKQAQQEQEAQQALQAQQAPEAQQAQAAQQPQEVQQIPEVQQPQGPQSGQPPHLQRQIRMPGQSVMSGQSVMPGQAARPGQPGMPGQSAIPGQPGIRSNILPGGQNQGPAGGPGPTAQRPAGQPAAGTSGYYLNLFGDRIAIPPEGGWIGREGIGQEWFDGNLMISRRHVFVKPNPQTGRLQVNEDKSLNGVFYTGADGHKVRLTGAQMINPGEILWIYNIPLRIERN